MHTSQETFSSGSTHCAATVYRGGSAPGLTPVVVMGNGITLTRRDGIPAYAERFTAAGFTVMAFDYRHWGDSGGEPRGWVSISRQRQDWRAAVAFARALPGVDPDRVALWGMSLGGGLALATAAADTRIAAVITLVPVTDGLAAWLQPAPPAHVARLLGRAVKEAMTRRPATMPIAGAPGEFAVLAAPEAVPGFTSVTAGRQWRNEVTTSFVFPMGVFRPVRMAPRIQAPVLYQIGDHDSMAPAADIEKAAHRTPKAEVRHYEMDHFGCFTPQHLPAVADDECTFLRAHLLPG